MRRKGFKRNLNMFRYFCRDLSSPEEAFFSLLTLLPAYDRQLWQSE